MSRHTRVRNHTVESSRIGNNGFNAARDALFAGDVCVYVLELVRKPFLHCREVVTGRTDVEGKYFDGGVRETDFCEAETDALICAGDCWERISCC